MPKKLKLEKHFSPKQKVTYYKLFCEGHWPFPEPIWGSNAKDLSLETAQNEFELAKLLGPEEYIKSSTIVKETVAEYEFPEKSQVPIPQTGKKKSKEIEYRHNA